MRGGIAERGGIRVGHRIIEINGQSVVATTHDKIIQILTNAVGEVRMICFYFINRNINTIIDLSPSALYYHVIFTVTLQFVSLLADSFEDHASFNISTFNRTGAARVPLSTACCLKENILHSVQATWTFAKLWKYYAIYNTA